MANAILTSIADLARLRRIDLRPDWADKALTLEQDGADALDLYCEAIGWPPSTSYADNPRTHEFPLVAYHPAHGWGVAEQVEGNDRLRVVQNGISTTWADAGQTRLYDLVIPLPASQQEFVKAFDVFKAAIWRRKHAIILATIVTIVTNVIALGTSIFSMQVYDRVVPRGAFSTLWMLLVGTIVALFFDFMLKVVRSNMLEKESADIDTEVSEFFFSRQTDVRLDARPPSIGSMAAQMRGLEQVRSVMSSSALFAMADLPFAIFFMVIIYMLGGVITVVLAAAFPISLAMAFGFAWMIRNDTDKAQISGNRKNGLLVEALDAAETIKANRGQWYLMSRWSTLLDTVHESEVPVRKLQAMAGSIFGMMQQISYVCLVAWGAIEVFENRMTMGALIACSILAGRVNGPLIAQLPGLLVQWSYSRSSLKMLDGILQLPADKPQGVEQLRPTRLAASLSFKDVLFVYPGARSGLSVPALQINAGERIGIVGPVGSGKSTLLKLMSGLYAPREGQILMDRLEMGQVADDVLRQTIGYLPQDYRLVNGSLRDNILLGLPDPGDDLIMEAATKTGLASMIASHPRGLDLEISEGGRGLSGGQRVLTGLTRLILARPKMLLLDEPTANLDPATEQLVLQTIQDSLAPDTTLIFVTHKMQLVSLVQRMLVVTGGEISIDGPTGEVLKQIQRPPAQPAGGQPGAGQPGIAQPQPDQGSQPQGQGQLAQAATPSSPQTPPETGSVTAPTAKPMALPTGMITSKLGAKA